MRTDRFDANLLLALEALVETESVTEASRRLNIGVSAASNVLRRLREHFGDELLVPYGRGMRATARGRELLPPTKQALLAIRKAITPPERFNPGSTKRKFVIASSDYVACTLLASLTNRLERNSPGIQVQIVTVDRDQWKEGLQNGKFDIIIWPQSYVSNEHVSEKIFAANCVCVIWNDNSLVGQGFKPEDLLAMGYVMVRVDSRFSTSWEDWLVAKLSKTGRVEVIVDNFHILSQYIIGTNRVTIMPYILARDMCRYLPLKILPDLLEVPHFQMIMQWHQSREYDDGHMWLRAKLREEADRLTQSDSNSA